MKKRREFFPVEIFYPAPPSRQANPISERGGDGPPMKGNPFQTQNPRQRLRPLQVPPFYCQPNKTPPRGRTAQGPSRPPRGTRGVYRPPLCSLSVSSQPILIDAPPPFRPPPPPPPYVPLKLIDAQPIPCHACPSRRNAGPVQAPSSPLLPRLQPIKPP